MEAFFVFPFYYLISRFFYCIYVGAIEERLVDFTEKGEEPARDLALFFPIIGELILFFMITSAAPTVVSEVSLKTKNSVKTRLFKSNKKEIDLKGSLSLVEDEQV